MPGCFVAVAAMLAAGAPLAVVEAQGGTPPGRTSRSAGGRDDRGREIEQQLQRRIAAIMKERLELTDEQLRRLEGVTVKLEQERRRVRGEEFRLRSALRRQLLAGDSASSDSVATLLDRMPAVERRKIDLMETEQRELAQFLTPLQRARYLALQDEIRRNMDEIRDRRGSSRSGERQPPDSTVRPRRP